MPDTLKITLAQHNQSVGDIPGNAAGILAARQRAATSDLIVFPELHLIGYPPEDLILKPALIERAAAELQKLAQATASDGPAMLVGSAFVLDGALHNGVALLDQGKVQAVRLKHELPNTGTFDELRLFQPGPLPEPVIVRGTMLGVPISEDIWRSEVCRHLADFGAEMLLCINGSPYEINKEALRIAGVAKRRAVDTGLPLAYLNRVGGQDELVFDGASFVINGDGVLAVQLRDWEAQEVETRWTKTAQGWRCNRGELHGLASHPEDVWCAMVLALRDFVDRNGYSGVALGSVENLDSATCAAIAIDAHGPERVHVGPCPEGDAMPLVGVSKTAMSLATAPATGGYNPLADAYATTVATLARWRNHHVPRIGLGPQGPVIPAELLAEPAAELPIAILDPILLGLVEHDKSVAQLAVEGFDRATVQAIEHRLHRGEAWRRQSAPGVKLTARNFGRDRRYPITHAFRSG